MAAIGGHNALMAEESPKQMKTHTLHLIIFITLLIIVIGLLFYFFNPYKFKPEPIQLTFSPIHEGTVRSIAYVMVFGKPPQDMRELRDVISMFERERIPITMFLAAYNSTDLSLLDIAEKFPYSISEFKHVDVHHTGSFPVRYADLSYGVQEDLLRKSRVLLKKDGFDARGFWPYEFAANYDTLLAAENSGHTFVIGGFRDSAPEHPPSLIGGVMQLLVYYLYPSQELPKGYGIYVIPLDFNALASNPKIINTLDDIPNTGFFTLTQLTESIRTTDKIAAQLTTNLAARTTTIQLSGINSTTLMKVTTKLIPEEVSTSSNNTALIHPGGFYIPLNASDQNVLIRWK